MLKNSRVLGPLVLVLAFCSIAHAQAIPTASSRGALQVGGGWSFAKPDYGQRTIQGISGFADWDFGLHWGIEADAHYIALITPTDLAENSYMAGPRIIYPRGRFKLYAKGLVGVGDLVVQEQQDNIGQSSQTNFAYAIGGGLDINATRHIAVRAIDFEYQHWNYLTGLTPTVFTVGAAYRFH
jgi:opacity protein-like surface antigen